MIRSRLGFESNFENVSHFIFNKKNFEEELVIQMVNGSWVGGQVCKKMDSTQYVNKLS